MFTPIWWRFHLDQHIFQVGWFNHQLVMMMLWWNRFFDFFYSPPCAHQSGYHVSDMAQLLKLPVLGCPRKLGSKVRISGLQPQYIPFISRLKPIDPNRWSYLPTGHPSTPSHFSRQLSLPRPSFWRRAKPLHPSWACRLERGKRWRPVELGENRECG